MTLRNLVDQWLRLYDFIDIIVSNLLAPMTARILHSLGIATLFCGGVFLAASPAKAISYTFTSASGQFSCDSTSIPQYDGTCTLSFNNFTADWDGSNWTFDQPSVSNTVTIANGADNLTLNTASPFTISGVDFTSGQQIQISTPGGANEIYFNLKSAPSATGPFLASIDQVQVVSTINTLDTGGLVNFSSGSAQAYAAPYFASALSILPILTSFKRIKRRVLSV